MDKLELTWVLQPSGRWDLWAIWRGATGFDIFSILRDDGSVSPK